MTNSDSIARSRDRSREDLSGLLLRLDPDVNEAWKQYDLIRRKLVKFFECYRCWPPEEYADEVLDRIAKKSNIQEIRDIPSFAVGIARNLRFECHKKNQRMNYFDASPGGDDAVADPHDYQRDIVEQIDNEVRLKCLKKCLTELRTRDRELILDYYSAEGLKQHEHRRTIAEKMGLNMNTLRVRMNRSREKLEQCVERCLGARRNKFSSGSENSALQR